MTEEKKPGRPAKIKVIVVRSIGTEDKNEEGNAIQAGPGEEVHLSRDIARKLQDAGAVKVAI